MQPNPSTFSIRRINPVLGVARVRPAAEYYRDVLGFSLDPDEGIFQPSADDPDGVYAIVKRNHAWIHFQIRRGDLPVRSRQSLERDLYIEVDDVAAVLAELTQRNANVIQPLFDAPYGFREFTVKDLNGYRLTFGQTI